VDTFRPDCTLLTSGYRTIRDHRCDNLKLYLAKLSFTVIGGESGDAEDRWRLDRDSNPTPIQYKSHALQSHQPHPLSIVGYRNGVRLPPMVLGS
jgi:hypothetical protein